MSPPRGSSSASNAGRGHANVNANAVVVAPGEFFEDTTAINMGRQLLGTRTIANRPAAASDAVCAAAASGTSTSTVRVPFASVSTDRVHLRLAPASRHLLWRPTAARLLISGHQQHPVLR